MPIKVTCPKCQGVLHAPDDAGGKRGKCPTCGTVLAIPAETPRTAVAPIPVISERPTLDAPTPRGGGLDDADDNPRPTSTPDQRRSSFASGFAKPDASPVRSSMGKLPPKPTDPFARPGRPAKSGAPSDGTTRALRRARRGLSVVQFALFLFLIAAIAMPGFELARQFKVPIPDKSPGYLGVPELSARQEIQAGAVVIPGVLGMLFLTLGRFGAANAPRSSFAKGPGLASALATLLALLGLLAIGAIVGQQIYDGFAPKGMMLNDDAPGIIQRAGLAAIILFLPLAELWFVSYIGRLGAGLHSESASGRHTRFVFFVGLVLGIVILAMLGTAIDPDSARDVRKWIDAHLSDLFAKLGDQEYAARNALCAFGGLLLWFWYFRLVGGGRKAIREWLDQNEPL